MELLASVGVDAVHDWNVGLANRFLDGLGLLGFRSVLDRDYPVVFANLYIFSLIGLLLGVDMWRRRRIIPRQPQWWLREHYSAMLGNGVATHIAFLVIGLPRLLPGIDGGALYYAAWFVPLVVSIAANVWLDRRFRFSGPSARPLATPTRA